MRRRRPFHAAGRAAVSDALRGTLFGLAAVLMWASYITFARQGVTEGLHPVDFVVLRYGVAGAIMAVWLARHEPRTLAGVSWGRGLALAACVGPLFIFTGIGGYVFAPLSHGAVVQPTVAALVGVAAATLLLREPLTLAKATGTALIVAGIATIALAAPSVPAPDAWIGDLLFAAAGTLFATFTILVRRWRVSPLGATAAVSVISALAMLPVVPFTDAISRLAALPPVLLVTQAIVQGVLSGLLAVVFFARAVELLGAGTAALFPALLPAVAMALGIPVTGEWPGPLEWTGGALASLGLAAATGALGAMRGAVGRAFSPRATR